MDEEEKINGKWAWLENDCILNLTFQDEIFAINLLITEVAEDEIKALLFLDYETDLTDLILLKRLIVL